jgi:hypothetical protein
MVAFCYQLDKFIDAGGFHDPARDANQGALGRLSFTAVAPKLWQTPVTSMILPGAPPQY